jgi:peptidoglycan/xylan/chitin deacetylase (PgdA/CDA1 family)
MEYITAQLNPVHLHDAIRYYRQNRRFPSRSVAITFDDGYENNVTLASPVLERYGVPATIFLSTQWVEEGGLFPFDRLRLLRWWKPELGASIPRHKKASIHAVLTWLGAHWPECQASLRPEQSRALRSLSWAQVRACSPARIRFGAHTHRHAILGNENRGDRRDEILTSVRLVRENTGSAEVAFCYPNGEPGDFDEEDQEIIRRQGCSCAVSNQAGANGPGADLYALRRYPIGLYHDRYSFLAEVTGLRKALAG